MTAPTRAQITADVTLPTFTVEVYTGASWVDVSADVVTVDHAMEATGDLAGFGFGVSRGATASVTFDAPQFATEWRGTPIRIKYGFSTSTKHERFVGIITGRSRSAEGGTWRCGGIDVRIEGAKLWSPPLSAFYRRPMATATGAATAEDPAMPGYDRGMFNWICWQTGGRPYEQAASYPNAVYYYSAEHALIAPEFSWVAGENAWEELGRLCRACGGQVYQDDLGVLRYVSPTGLARTSPTHTYTDTPQTAAQRAANGTEHYADISEDSNLESVLTGVTVPFVRRIVGGVQEIYTDQTPRTVAAGVTATLTLDTQLPLFSFDRAEVECAVLRTVRKVNPAEAVVTASSVAAQRVLITVQNTLAEPIQINAVKLFGRPVSAGEEGSAYYSTSGVLQTGRTQEAPDNPYIQTEAHARMLARMLFDFYVGDRGLVSLTGCMYDPDRIVGEPVYLTYSGWAETAELCRIVAIRPSGGDSMDVDLGRADGLPVRDQHFLIGTTYASADTRALSY